MGPARALQSHRIRPEKRRFSKMDCKISKIEPRLHGIAFASLVTAWFLGAIERSDTSSLVPALHKAYLLLGLLSVASAATFLTLRREDGANVSGHGRTSPAPEEVT